MDNHLEKKKILIVDDDAGIRLMIKRVLRTEERYEFEEAQDGLQAEEKLKSFLADLVILDIMMPNKDGYATCKDIRDDERLKGIKIIGISGNSGEIGKIFIEEYGADFFIEKPFNSKEFKEIVFQMLWEEE